ncbi:MAG TPA: hypothetical protein VFD47_11765 [Actinomycetota bacterium]|nr:hypothetical protein [Actinomycetota bacterium]
MDEATHTGGHSRRTDRRSRYSTARFGWLWPGRKNNAGKKVKSGKYTYSIKATDDDGNSATKSGKTTVRR